MSESHQEIWPWTPTHFDIILAEVGRISFFWNQLEDLIKSLTLEIAGFVDKEKNNEPSDAAKILITNMQSATMVTACKSIAHTCLPESERDHALHLAGLVDTLRVYRNAFVHDFRSNVTRFVPDAYLRLHPVPGSERGILYGTNVRIDGLQTKELLVTAQQTRDVAQVFQQAVKYARSVRWFYRVLLGHVAADEEVTSHKPPEKYVLPQGLLSLHPDQKSPSGQAPPQPSHRHKKKKDRGRK